MKTTWIASMKRSLFPVIMAALFGLASNSCGENSLGFPPEEEIAYDDGKVITEYFKAYPTGSTIHAFDGDVILHFPPGTVATTTRFSITTFPLDQLDLKGRNVMMRAFALKNVTNQNEFENPVTLLMRYDLCGYNMCEPSEGSELAIYRFYGDRYAVHKIEAVGDCSMNCSCKTVKTCIEECGTYVVVEK